MLKETTTKLYPMTTNNEYKLDHYLMVLENRLKYEAADMDDADYEKFEKRLSDCLAAAAEFKANAEYEDSVTWVSGKTFGVCKHMINTANAYRTVA